MHMKNDPFVREIIRNRLVAASQEMATTMIRTAFNPLLYEIQDFSVTIMSPNGDMWAETPGVVVFSQSFPAAVRAGIKRWKGNFAPGDVLIVNDPFQTGTHISDTNIYVPVFFQDKLVAFCGVAAHWSDIGGKTPGGWCPDSTEMIQEGICFRHQKLIAAGTPNEALLDLIADNVRTPDIVKGDLEAQISSCRQGMRRVQELCQKYGAETVIDSMEAVIRETDRSMRELIKELPDGIHEHSMRLDGDGVDPNADCLIKLTVKIQGDRVICSLAGSSPTAMGPVNTPKGSTTGILASALKGLLLPYDPCNAGHSMAIEFDVPKNTIVNPALGAPTDSYAYVNTCLIELMFRAFAELVPERCPAGGYQLAACFFGRAASENHNAFVLTDATHGGNGARSFDDGVTNMQVGMGDLPNNPVEVTETRAPVRISWLKFVPTSAGAGEYRGGMGVSKEYELLEDGIYANFVNQSTLDTTAVGVAGGMPGISAHLTVKRPGQDPVSFKQMQAGIGPLEAGSRVCLVTGGGGGWGDPRNRPREAVISDVRNEYLTPHEASKLYQVNLVCHEAELGMKAVE